MKHENKISGHLKIEVEMVLVMQNKRLVLQKKKKKVKLIVHINFYFIFFLIFCSYQFSPIQLLLNSLFLKAVLFFIFIIIIIIIFLRCDTRPLNKFPIEIIAYKAKRKNQKLECCYSNFVINCREMICLQHFYNKS